MYGVSLRHRDTIDDPLKGSIRNIGLQNFKPRFFALLRAAVACNFKLRAVFREHSRMGRAMPRGLKIFAAFIAGLVAGEGIAIAGYIIATNLFGFFDREGAGAMGTVFVIGPVFAIVLAILFAVIAAKRTKPT